MLSEKFETDRPVFFISDKNSFNPVLIDMKKFVHAKSETTISLSCAIITDEIENVLNIYIDENFEPDETMEFIAKENLKIPSGVLEITDSDLEIIFERNIEVNLICIEIYVNRNHDYMPEKFNIIIRTISNK